MKELVLFRSGINDDVLSVVSGFGYGLGQWSQFSM